MEEKKKSIATGVTQMNEWMKISSMWYMGFKLINDWLNESLILMIIKVFIIIIIRLEQKKKKKINNNNNHQAKFDNNGRFTHTHSNDLRFHF